MLNIGQLIQELRELKSQLAELSKQTNDLKALRDEKEAQLIAHLREIGLSQISDGKDTVSLTDTVVPQVYDWPAFYKYIHENEAYYLLERRPTATAYRELREQTESEIPGVRDYVKPTLSLRKK